MNAAETLKKTYSVMIGRTECRVLWNGNLPGPAAMTFLTVSIVL